MQHSSITSVILRSHWKSPEKQVKFPGSNIEFDIASDLQNKISNISQKFKLEDMTFRE